MAVSTRKKQVPVLKPGYHYEISADTGDIIIVKNGKPRVRRTVKPVRKKPVTRGTKRVPIRRAVDARRKPTRASRGLVRQAVGTAGRVTKRQRALKPTGRKWHGPLGALGDDVVVEITPSDNFKAIATMTSKQINQFANTTVGANPDFSWARIFRALFAMWEGVEGNLKMQIGPLTDGNKGRVPADTFSLRKAMHATIDNMGTKPVDQKKVQDSAKAGKFLLRVIMNTKGIAYGGPVNQMSTEMLAHPHSDKDGNLITQHGRTGKKLNDPNAKKGWYNLTLVNGRNFSKKVFSNMIQSLSPGGRANYQFYRSLFKVVYK